jgi:hypothetical protein
MLRGLLDVSSLRMAESNSRNMWEKHYEHTKLCAVVGKIKVYIVTTSLDRIYAFSPQNFARNKERLFS